MLENAMTNLRLQYSTLNTEAESWKERKNNSDVTTSVNYVWLHFQVGLSLYVIPEWTIREFKAPQQLAGRHLSPPRASPWLKISSPPGYPHYDWMDHRWWRGLEIKC